MSDFAGIIPDDRRMNIVDGYFLFNYANLSEEDLGNILGLSSRQVQRFLKKNYGKSFSEMKREAKLNKAFEFMRNNNLSSFSNDICRRKWPSNRSWT